MCLLELKACQATGSLGERRERAPGRGDWINRGEEGERKGARGHKRVPKLPGSPEGGFETLWVARK